MDFPGSPVVKASPSNTGVQVWFQVEELKSHMLQGLPETKQNIKQNIVTDSTKTF